MTALVLDSLAREILKFSVVDSGNPGIVVHDGLFPAIVKVSTKIIVGSSSLSITSASAFHSSLSLEGKRLHCSPMTLEMSGFGSFGC